MLIADFIQTIILGLSFSSSWGNGHAQHFAHCSQALHCRGHRIVPLSATWEWYKNTRDLSHPAYCEVKIFESWEEILPAVKTELCDSDVAFGESAGLRVTVS